jgi:tyrosinase
MRPRSFRWYAAASLLLLDLGSSVLASPLLRPELVDAVPELRRRQNPTVSVTGITAFGVQPRLEIRQLEQNTDQWNIFLLGLARFQQTDQSNLTSYYQIAGIHHALETPPGDNLRLTPTSLPLGNTC